MGNSGYFLSPSAGAASFFGSSLDESFGASFGASLGASSFFSTGGRGSDSGSALSRSPPTNEAALALTISLPTLPDPPQKSQVLLPLQTGHFVVPLQLGHSGVWPWKIRMPVPLQL